MERGAVVGRCGSIGGCERSSVGNCCLLFHYYIFLFN